MLTFTLKDKSKLGIVQSHVLVIRGLYWFDGSLQGFGRVFVSLHELLQGLGRVEPVVFQHVLQLKGLRLTCVHLSETPEQLVRRLVPLAGPGSDGSVSLDDFGDVGQGFVQVVGYLSVVPVFEGGGEEFREALGVEAVAAQLVGALFGRAAGSPHGLHLEVEPHELPQGLPPLL